MDAGGRPKIHCKVRSNGDILEARMFLFDYLEHRSAPRGSMGYGGLPRTVGPFRTPVLRCAVLQATAETLQIRAVNHTTIAHTTSPT